MENQVLTTIRERRSTFRFKPDPVSDEEIRAILEAGRWAPSWTNTQPWEFILVRDNSKKERICKFAHDTLLITDGGSTQGCACIIAICVDPTRDPYHYIEDGAVATQNMALAAHSLGLGTYWAGVFNIEKAQGSLEEKIKSVLGIPDQIRVVAILPVGIPAYGKEGDRRLLRDILHYDEYGNKADYLKL
jgi:nitroreductase